MSHQNVDPEAYYKWPNRTPPACYFEGDPAWQIEQMDERQLDRDPFGSKLFKEMKEKYDTTET